VVTVTGDLDIATVPALAAQLGGLIKAGRASVVLDLAGLDFIGAAGITALVIAVRTARECRVRLHLACVPVHAARVLDLGWPVWRLIAFDTVAAAAERGLSTSAPEREAEPPASAVRKAKPQDSAPPAARGGSRMKSPRTPRNPPSQAESSPASDSSGRHPPGDGPAS
jgi:anti-anti-sigma factor